MSDSVQKCIAPAYYYPPKKSSTGKQLGTLAGVGATSYAIATGDIFKSFGSEVSDALNHYKYASNKKELKSLMPKKEFVKNFIKSERLARCGEAAAIGAFCVSAGLALGILADKAIDAVKNKKAKKAQNPQIIY